MIDIRHGTKPKFSTKTKCGLELQTVTEEQFFVVQVMELVFSGHDALEKYTANFNRKRFAKPNVAKIAK